jgi:parallel beta-helix repeat protein
MDLELELEQATAGVVLLGQSTGGDRRPIAHRDPPRPTQPGHADDSGQDVRVLIGAGHDHRPNPATGMMRRRNTFATVAHMWRTGYATTGNQARAGLCCVVGVAVAIALAIAVPPSLASASALAAPTSPRRVCGSAALRSPYDYTGASGSYSSGTPGLPTYGSAGSDFPNATGGVVIPPGRNEYASYQLAPDTVYYLLPGMHVGSFQADSGDAFVGGSAGRRGTTLSGKYRGANVAIDSNYSDGDQAGVTIEYLTIERYEPPENAAAVNQETNTGWTIRDDTVRRNVPGAGAFLGSEGTIEDDCLIENGQYGFQSAATAPWGQDSLTSGPYDLTVTDNEIAHNDTCDFEGLLTNAAIGWEDYDPVPAKYRNRRCPPVFPDGDQGAFKLWQTDGATITGNYIHENWGPGSWADTDNANTTIADNYFSGNDGPAVVEEISYDFAVSDNTMIANDVVGGLSNPGFPQPAVYISESGSDPTFGGVPACAEAACAGQGAYPDQSTVTGNVLTDNGGSVFLWQSSDRYCGDGLDGACTLTDGAASGPFTIEGCAANLGAAALDTTSFQGEETGSPVADWWDGCLWRTANVLVAENTIDFTPSRVTDCNQTDWPDCGAGGLFSQYGSIPPYDEPGGWVIPSQLTFHQNDVWRENTYNGPSTFYAWNQGNGENPVSWAAWSGATAGGDECGSAGERQSGFCEGPFGQDAGSTYQTGAGGDAIEHVRPRKGTRTTRAASRRRGRHAFREPGLSPLPPAVG